MASPSTLFRRLPDLRQRSRRIAVIAAYVGYPLQILGYTLLVQPGRIPNVIWAPASIVLFGASVIGLVVVAGYAQGRFDKRDAFDERQRSMVDGALIVAYGVLTTVIVLFVGGLALYASFVGPITIDMSALSPWLLAVAIYVPFLPLAALAWIEPDAPSDVEG